jgi:Mrp family chromosome partitioning ATPase/capsular polysaccharide biosynthesis protein
MSHSAASRALRTIKRRFWLILLATAIVAGLAVFFSIRQDPLYEASARVLLNDQNLASGLTGLEDVSPIAEDPVRAAQTQTEIATSPAVARRAARAAGIPGVDENELLDRTSVTADPDSDILVFEARFGDPETAERLATVHAQAFVDHRKRLDTAVLVTAREELETRIDELRAGEFRNSPIVERLIENAQQLRTLEALQTANATLLRAATGAEQVQPKTLRNVVLGVVLGLMLGIGLVFAADALDTRVRSSSEIRAHLKLPLLARLAAPPRKNRKKNRLVTVTEPQGPRAESFRLLRSNLDFVNIDRGARSIIVTSALEREGKSTTVANLAVALARAGRRVALVDLDLRKPLLERFFGIERSHSGLTSVVVGHSSLEEALVDVPLASGFWSDAAVGENSDRGSSIGLEGRLHVLSAGPIPPDPGEFVSSPKLELVLDQLEDTHDLVLVDTPPLLAVGDTRVMSGYVDAMIVVASLRYLKRPILQELAGALATCPAVMLGFVATGAEADEVSEFMDYGYGYYESEYRAESASYGSVRSER